ncbi:MULTISPECIES: phage minor head protein [Campylobacter]|uniref:phage head morphogenesis protein n=1 Tax=Campylobacter TaxID=194 RepID=UPI0019D160FF|nr:MULTISPECIES: phage minor head protein [Campylobacter]MBN7287439.1 minor capsid protein [Campylobacter curvus]MDU6828108.1 phage minor head protein [Campylobacter sp.]
MSDLGFSFFEEPTTVYEYMASKKPEIHFDYDEIMHDAHKKAFTIAKMTNLDLLKDMQGSLTKAFKDGIGFEEWKQSVKPILVKKGWLGNVKVKDPNTGEKKEIYVGNRRLKTIYNTNMRTAYAKARYESQMQSLGEYFRYTAVLDGRTRASHRRLHGKTLPKTDPFWDTNYPPNGYNCRCKVQVLTKAECEARGITPLADGSFLPKAAEKDFAYNPGKVEKIDEIFKDKKDAALQSLTSPKAKKALQELLKEFEHERDIYVWQKGLDDMVGAVLAGKIIKDKTYQIAQVGELKPKIKKALEELDIKPKAQSIVIYQNTISHITRDSKPKIKEPNADEIRAIVGVFDKAKHVFYDRNDNKLIYFYDSLQNDNMANYIVVNLDFVLKKFRTDNFIATISKMPIINFKNIVKDKKRYKKVK